MKSYRSQETKRQVDLALEADRAKANLTSSLMQAQRVLLLGETTGKKESVLEKMASVFDPERGRHHGGTETIEEAEEAYRLLQPVTSGHGSSLSNFWKKYNEVAFFCN